MTLVKVNNPATRFDGLMKEFFNEFNHICLIDYSIIWVIGKI